MFNNLGYPAASSLLGGIVRPVFSPFRIQLSLIIFQGALLTIVPWVLLFFGPKIRAKSKFASVR